MDQAQDRHPRDPAPAPAHDEAGALAADLSSARFFPTEEEGHRHPTHAPGGHQHTYGHGHAYSHKYGHAGHSSGRDRFACETKIDRKFRCPSCEAKIASWPQAGRCFWYVVAFRTAAAEPAAECMRSLP